MIDCLSLKHHIMTLSRSSRISQDKLLSRGGHGPDGFACFP
jgi:hypothetical protein